MGKNGMKSKSRIIHKEVKKQISYTDFIRDEEGNLMNKKTKKFVKTNNNNKNRRR